VNSLTPLFRDGTGRISADPLALTCPTPTVDLTTLGLLLAPPALLGEFIPRALWRGVERIRPALPMPRAGSLPYAFGAAVEDLTGDVEVIGVKVSGGLDSLAVLAHVVRAASGRRVIAFTTDMTCDAGTSTATVVRPCRTRCANRTSPDSGDRVGTCVGGRTNHRSCRSIPAGAGKAGAAIG
jgi:asparagine synthase (glutamine-hydrolysing)